MNLSNRLTFSIVFSVLLVAAFAFVVAPAMAQEMVTYYGTRTDNTAEKDGKWEVTFTFSEGGSFAKTDFTSKTDADPPVTVYNISLGGTALTKAQFDAAKFEGGNKLTVVIPKSATVPGISFTVTGFTPVTMSATVAEDDAVTLGSAITGTTALQGKEYRVYVRAAEGTEFQAGVEATALTGDQSFPADLENFFNVGGGTIDLKITGTAKNSKRVIINEIMWAVDDRLIGQDGQYDQQWIEIYNPTSIPVEIGENPFVFTNNPSGLNPPPEIADGTSDRLSNINTRTNVWTLKGSSRASSTLGEGVDAGIIGADPQFKSMYRSQPGKNGFDAGSWVESTLPYIPGFLGTPGGKNTRAGLPTAVSAPSAVNPAFSTIIINEIGISEDGDDWVELYNKGDAAQSLKNWKLSLATEFGTEAEIYTFPDSDLFFEDDDDDDLDVKAEIPSKGYLLLVNEDPEDTKLSRGYDVTKGHDDQAYGVVNENTNVINPGYHHYYIVGEGKIDIPHGSNDWLLVLRSDKDNKFLTTSHKIQDVAGPGGGEAKFKKTGQLNLASPAKDKKGDGKAGGLPWNTTVWPLNGRTDKVENLLQEKDDRDKLSTKDVVWQRDSSKHGFVKEGFTVAPFTGIGYDRSASGDQFAGTPGHPNNAIQKEVGTLSTVGSGMVFISELMLTKGNRARDPQWIELYNSSKTQAVDLAADDGWVLTIENHDSGQWEGERELVVDINLSSLKTIPPGQTVLIVSTEARQLSETNDNPDLPDHRILVISNDKDLEDAFFMESRFDPFINTKGFHLTLTQGKADEVTKKKAVADEVGNLDGNNRTYDDPHEAWSWPTDLTEDDERTSLIRLRDEDGTPHDATPDLSDPEDMTGAVLPLGSKSRGRDSGWAFAWVHADDTAFEEATNTYYGDSGDVGTPGHTAGAPLPVSLSYFRPTLENGEVVIRWTTESELDNAGFNILRSDSRNGEFKQVNAGMIHGHGTTGERNTYKWVDESAKLGVVYYYQIEDVSFAGEHQTLTTTKLKGLISANNKLTTLWGGLKSQD